MKRIVIEFFKDKLPTTVAFFLSDFVIIAFYYLTTKEEIELLYPITLSIFIYGIYLVIEYVHYTNMYQKVQSLRKFQESNRKVYGAMDVFITDTMREIHKEYQTRILIQQEDRKGKDRFLSTWIHNLKTPISVTKLILERYQNGELDKQAVCKQLEQENKRMEQQLDLLLEMIRLKEFVNDYTPQLLDLNEELQKILNDNKRLFIYSHVYPIFHKTEDKCNILSDHKWNTLVINQLISNAVKYSQDGREHHIYFSIETKEHTCILKIRDEGIGIPEYDLPRVYDAFFTGENGRKDKRSSGIGLYFCKQVLTMLGHELTIESKPSKGTTVTIKYLTKLKG